MEQHRINDFTIVSLNKSIESYEMFGTINGSTNVPKQLFHPFDNEKIVIISQQKLNKYWSTLPILDNDWFTQNQTQLPSFTIKFLFSGIPQKLLYLGVKDLENDEFVLNVVVYPNEIPINQELILIDNRYWNYSLHYRIPFRQNARYVVCSRLLEPEEVIQSGPEIGKIIGLSAFEYVPIIAPKINDDTIQCQLKWNDNQAIKFGIASSLNKDIKQVILDTFNVKDALIDLEYLVSIGNPSLGFTTLTTKNNDNLFAPIEFIPNLERYKNQMIYVVVTMRLTVDGKLLQREVVSERRTINWLYTDFETSNGNQPIEHNKIEVIKEERIEQIEIYPVYGETQVLTLTEQVYSRVLSDKDIDINLSDNIRIITLDDLNLEATGNGFVLVISNSKTNEIVTSLKGKQYKDGRVCFDLDLLIFPKQETSSDLSYVIFNGDKIIRQGSIKK